MPPRRGATWLDHGGKRGLGLRVVELVEVHVPRIRLARVLVDRDLGEPRDGGRGDVADVHEVAPIAQAGSQVRGPRADPHDHQAERRSAREDALARARVPAEAVGLRDLGRRAMAPRSARRPRPRGATGRRDAHRQIGAFEAPFSHQVTRSHPLRPRGPVPSPRPSSGVASPSSRWSRVPGRSSTSRPPAPSPPRPGSARASSACRCG